MTDRVVVYGKPDCHLCADATRAVERVCAELGVGWHEQDITGDGELWSRWAEFVPVVVVDGEIHGWFRVDEPRLRAELTRAV
jgi:glutaredoxin